MVVTQIAGADDPAPPRRPAPDLLSEAVRDDILVRAKDEFEAAIRFARHGSYPDPNVVFGQAADVAVPS